MKIVALLVAAYLIWAVAMSSKAEQVGRDPMGCRIPDGVTTLWFGAAKYPNIKRHTEQAIRAGWPEVLIVNRQGAEQRRQRLMRASTTPPSRAANGYERDEYPPAVGRGEGRGLTRGEQPDGWKAHIAYVPATENSQHGAKLGGKLRKLCNGSRFRYGWRGRYGWR